MIRALSFLAALAAVGAALLVAPAAKADGGIACDRAAIYDASTNGATKLITGATKTKVYICGFVMFGGGTANVSLKTGTGTNCGTGTAALTPAFNLVAQAKVDDQSAYWRGLVADIATDVCINTSAGVAVQAIVYYTQR